MRFEINIQISFVVSRCANIQKMRKINGSGGQLCDCDCETSLMDETFARIKLMYAFYSKKSSIKDTEEIAVAKKRRRISIYKLWTEKQNKKSWSESHS